MHNWQQKEDYVGKVAQKPMLFLWCGKGNSFETIKINIVLSKLSVASDLR